MIKINDFDRDQPSRRVDLNRGIGSEFWLPSYYLSDTSNNQFLNIQPEGKKIFVTSGREAIYQIIKSLKLSKEEEVLLPSYLCPSVVEPFIKTSTEIQFYKINKNLEMDLEDIQEKINDKTKAILLIHYFGFPQPLTGIKKLKEKLLVIENTTHSFLSSHDGKPSGSYGDISIVSFRKMLPIPDSAMISYNNECISIPPLAEQDTWHLKYKKKRESALLYRGEFIRTGNKFHEKSSLETFNEATELLQKIYSNPCKMSDTSKELLESMRVDEIIHQRRKNFASLLKERYEGIVPFYETLPNGICPLGFPVLSDNRDNL